MGDIIDISLDDIIKSNRKPGIRGGRRGGLKGAANRGRSNRRVGGKGIFRGRFQKPRSGTKVVGLNISFEKSPKGNEDDVWKHNLFESVGGGMKQPRQSPAFVGVVSGKLHISNLDSGVSESDIQELFAEFGPLRKAAVHYEKSGRSLGTAEVIYEHHSDALKALKQYNNVPLDGCPMNIHLIGAIQGGSPAMSRLGRRGGAGRGGAHQTFGQRQSNGFSGSRGRSSISGHGGHVGNRGSSANKKPLSAEELDAQLDAYNAIKMVTD